MANILIYNGKGGASKSTNSNIIASNIKDVVLIEIDKVNETQSDIKGDFEVIQVDFNHENEQSFLEFENLLLEDKNTVIDIGASKIDIFHTCMMKANLYDLIDLLIVPGMDGYDDFNTALDLLTTLKGIIPAEKIIFSFNRFNEHEYSSSEEQFDNFFNNKELIKNTFNIDLDDCNTWYVLKDSRAIKYARNSGISLKTLADKDLAHITKLQRAETNKDKRLELTKQKSLITQAQSFHNNYVVPMMEKIFIKLSVKNNAKQKEKNKMYLDLKEKKSLIVLVLAVALVIGTIAYYTHKSSVLSSSLKADGSNKVEEIESLRDSYLSPSKKQVTVGFSKREVSNNDEFDILVNQTGDIKLQDIMEKEDYDYLVYRYFEIKYNKLLDKKQEIAKLDEALEKEEKIGLDLLENKKITKQQYKDILVNLKKDFEKKKEPLFDGLEYIKNKPISLNRGKIKQIALDFKKDRNSYEKLSENSRNRSLLFSQLFGEYYRDSHKSLAYDLNKILESKNKITLLDLFPNVELEIKFETELIDRLDRVKKIKYQLEYLIENTANRTDILELKKERNVVWKEKDLIEKLIYNLDYKTPMNFDYLKSAVLSYQLLKSNDNNQTSLLINKLKNLKNDYGRNVTSQKTIDELLAKKSREDQLLNDYEIRMEEYRIKKEKEKQALKDFVFENALNKK